MPGAVKRFFMLNIAPTLGLALIRGLGWSWRFRETGGDILDRVNAGDRPIVAAFLHGDSVRMSCLLSGLSRRITGETLAGDAEDFLGARWQVSWTFLAKSIREVTVDSDRPHLAGSLDERLQGLPNDARKRSFRTAPATVSLIGIGLYFLCAGWGDALHLIKKRKTWLLQEWHLFSFIVVSELRGSMYLVQ